LKWRFQIGDVVVSAGCGRESPGSRRAFPASAADELVADVADRADHRLVLRAELGAEAAHVYVDRPGAAEVVIAPDLLHQGER